MQPIGLLVWIYQAQFKKEKQEFVARKLDSKGWTKYLSISVLWWLAFGFIYQSIGANGYSGQLPMSFLSISGGEKACKFKGNT